KIIKIYDETIEFNDGSKLYSFHDQSCCESHYLDPSGIELDEVNDLIFDLDKPLEEIIERVPGYGIRLIPRHGMPLSIPGYGYNNGYYSDNLSLTLSRNNGSNESLNITDCQVIKG